MYARRSAGIFLAAAACSASMAAAQDSAPAADPAVAATPGATPVGMNSNATFLLSSERLQGEDQTILWPGFLNGLRGFEQFYDPVGQPIYFESPFINTSARLIYIYHTFAEGSQLQGGDLNVVAAQARLAITERLALIATKDGYSWLNPGIFPAEEDGWNDIALGLKYAFYVDREAQMVITGGARWQWANGNHQVLQGYSQEISPFVSLAKGWDKFHLIADATVRLPFDDNDGNTVFQWDAHFDYEVFEGFAPCIELHGLHYWTNAENLDLTVGGLDYANIGSSGVAGSTVIWMGLGGRFKFSPNVSAGCTYEFALTNKNADIMDQRVTVDLTFTW